MSMNLNQNSKKILFLLWVILGIWSCKNTYTLSRNEAQNISINQQQLKAIDSNLVNTILPYKQKLDAQMNEVIGLAEQELKKELPDGSLGNFVADACLTHAQKLYSNTIDFCVLNNGGIRIPSIAQGNITVGRMYELMPFDNNLEVVILNGADCELLFNWIAKWKGAPVSGLSIELTVEGSWKNAMINGVPFNKDKTYTIATTDFIANGGDGAVMFKNGARTAINYKLRDALIEYVKNRETIKANNNGRIKQN
ncbi:MAG: 5'-nucleotidase C-terminal domain-containing protein [Bacteroidota bacterium]|jgi:2',3'-cyclic-nucleotide 2'-phosphodiesterase (5'-nucleotidase family)